MDFDEPHGEGHVQTRRRSRRVAKNEAASGSGIDALTASVDLHNNRHGCCTAKDGSLVLETSNAGTMAKADAGKLTSRATNPCMVLRTP
jgi:hypothetical protein